jgi:hypothetical protein
VPEVYSMSRWNEEDKYGDRPMMGDRYIHSIRHKKPKKPHAPRGCPNNEHGPHFWVCNKRITQYLDRSAYQREVYHHFNVFCLLCGLDKRAWGKTPSRTIECLVTIVERRGPWQNGFWSSYKELRFDGETDHNGKTVSRWT